jgi:hypothetical protein
MPIAGCSTAFLTRRCSRGTAHVHSAASDTVSVRRVARNQIPGTARMNSEGGSWVTRLTSIRKERGTIACCGKQQWEEDV